MRFVVTTCIMQLISHCVNAKITPTSVNWVKETRLSLHVGPRSCYYKSHRVNWPLDMHSVSVGNRIKNAQSTIVSPSWRSNFHSSDMHSFKNCGANLISNKECFCKRCGTILCRIQNAGEVSLSRFRNVFQSTGATYSPWENHRSPNSFIWFYFVWLINKKLEPSMEWSHIRQQTRITIILHQYVTNHQKTLCGR